MVSVDCFNFQILTKLIQLCFEIKFCRTLVVQSWLIQHKLHRNLSLYFILSCYLSCTFWSICKHKPSFFVCKGRSWVVTGGGRAWPHWIRTNDILKTLKQRGGGGAELVSCQFSWKIEKTLWQRKVWRRDENRIREAECADGKKKHEKEKRHKIWFHYQHFLVLYSSIKQQH